MIIESRKVLAPMRTYAPVWIEERLDAQAYPVRVARRRVSEVLASWDALEWDDTATLLVSEMVTNAVRHGTPPITLRLGLLPDEDGDGRALLVEVGDGSARPPDRREPGESGGFGIWIVEALAEVDIVAHDEGKTMRALLPDPGRAEVDVAAADGLDTAVG